MQHIQWVKYSELLAYINESITAICLIKGNNLQIYVSTVLTLPQLDALANILTTNCEPTLV